MLSTPEPYLSIPILLGIFVLVTQEKGGMYEYYGVYWSVAKKSVISGASKNIHKIRLRRREISE